MTRNNPWRRGISRGLILAFLLTAGAVSAENSVDSVMDAVLTRLYANFNADALCKLDDAAVQAFLTPEERRTFATKHWCFDANVPVIVSVLRNVKQPVAPFWLAETGFEKTALQAVNQDGWTYEVWQKPFPAGRIELGINGFDDFRPHYFVCVGPQHAGDTLTLSGFYPANQTVTEMKEGAPTYLDWTELVLTSVPERLRGQQLLPTIRGRAREAALVDAFRTTPFPSSEKPAAVFLTWSGDPKTTQTIQWRVSPNVADGVVRYREKASTAPFREASAVSAKMEDRLLANDRFCNWFRATLSGLKPGTAYEYQVGSRQRDAWSDRADFITEPGENAPFSFLYCSDTHSHKDWGDLLKAVFDRYPQAAFCTVSGDLVGTGLHRDDWDTFLGYGAPMFQRRPIMPAIGNHDAQLGLAPRMYLDIFGLPENGPRELEAKRAYTFTYSNAQFFVLDVMSDTGLQQTWLREQLAASKAAWKFAIFHFPFFVNGAEYAELEKKWGDLFDEYHVDAVLTGHVHQHIRSYPMRGGKRAASPREGTVYITSVSIPSEPLPEPMPDWAEAWVKDCALCNVFEVDGNRCVFRAVAADGAVKDEMVLEK
jgi:hypothetical protein